MPEPYFKISSHEKGIQFSAVIQPRSSKNEIAGTFNSSLKIRLTSPPIDGAANKTCIKFLAKFLGISPSRIQIVSGMNNKNKTISIKDMDDSSFRAILISKTPNLYKES
jgi:uncharacterized protein